MTLLCQAHVPADRQNPGIVRYLPRPKRSWWGWALFVGFIVANELRGTYMAAQFLAEFLKASGTHV